MKSFVTKHKEFIDLVASGASQADAYLQAISKKSNKTKQNLKNATEKGSILAKRYRKEIDASKKKIIHLVESVKDNKVVNEAVQKILAVAEVDARLCEIIKGETKETKFFVLDGKIQTVQVPISNSDLIKAIEAYYKRHGMNEPVRTDLTSDGKPLNFFPPAVIIINPNDTNT